MTVAGASPELEVAGAAGWPNTLSAHDWGAAIEGVWPAVFFGAERVPELRRKVRDLDWAAAAVAQWRDEAEAVLAAPPALPVGAIGWRHDFYSPGTAEHLLFDRRSADGFVDPWDGATYGPDVAADPTAPAGLRAPARARRNAWRLLVHERTYRLMHSLAVLYALTGDERYARWVAEGGRAAGEMFRREDLRARNRDRALYFQPLYDAQVLLFLATAYDLTRESAAYAAADHAALRCEVFEAAVPYQLAFLDGTAPQNMMAYVDAALVACGDATDRPEWRRAGYEHPRSGYFALLAYGLRRDARGETDGFWVEGTQFYHLYSVCPLVLLHERATARRDESARALTALLDAPRRMADDRLRLPAFGDLGAPRQLNLRLYRHLYEYAAGRLDAARFGPTLARIYGDGTPRNSLAAVAYGPDARPAAPRRPSWRSERFGAMGIAFLRDTDRRRGERYQVWLRAGAHGEGHDHPDKLAFGLHAAGEPLVADLGTAGYGLREHTAYCRSTFSHSTLFVDERPQARVRAASLRSGARWASGVVADAYPGVRLERRLRLRAPFVLLEDGYESPDEHRYGWALHVYGSLAVEAPPQGGADPAPGESGGPCGGESPAGLPGLPEDGPFASFTNRRGGVVAAAGRALRADWRVAEGLWLRLWAWSDGPFAWTAGQTPGNPMPDRRGTLVLRAVGRTRRFRAALEVHHGAPVLDGPPDALFAGRPFSGARPGAEAQRKGR